MIVANNKSTKNKPLVVAPVYLPQEESFAKVSVQFRDQSAVRLDDNEFRFLLATAIQTVHGEFANQVEILDFKDQTDNYSAIIKFRTIHYTRVVTSLLLFGEWKGTDCRIEVHKVVSTPCLLSI